MDDRFVLRHRFEDPPVEDRRTEVVRGGCGLLQANPDKWVLFGPFQSIRQANSFVTAVRTWMDRNTDLEVGGRTSKDKLSVYMIARSE